MSNRMKNRGLSKIILAVIFCMLIIMLTSVSSVEAYAATESEACGHCLGRGWVCKNHFLAINGNDSKEQCSYGDCDNSKNGTLCSNHICIINQNAPCPFCKGTGRKHKQGTYHKAVAETCTTAGNVEYWECTGCDEFIDANSNVIDVTIPAQGHKKGTYYKAVAETCTTAGNVEYWICTGCKKNIDADFNVIANITIPAKGHELGIHHEAVAETCTGDGNVEYWECTGCDEYLDADANVIEDVTIPAKGHAKGTHHKALEATCTETGNVEYWACSRCDEYIDADANVIVVTIPALGHEPVLEEKRDTTYYKAGNTRDYWKCNRCEKCFEDKECTKEITDIDSLIIPRLNYAEKYFEEFSDYFEIIETKGYWVPSEEDGISGIKSDECAGNVYSITFKAKEYCIVPFVAKDLNTKGALYFEHRGERKEVRKDLPQSFCLGYNKEYEYTIEYKQGNENDTVWFAIDKSNIFDEEVTPRVREASLSLLDTGDIGINFYIDNVVQLMSKNNNIWIDISSSTYGSTYDIYNIKTSYEMDNGDWKGDEDISRFTCRVPAKSINDTISIKMYDRNKGIIPFANESASEDGILRYSVNDYINSAINSEETSDELKALVKAMQNYGLCAQDYFGYNAPGEMPEIDDNIDYSAYEVVKDGTLPEGVSYVGSSLILESKTSIRHYFSIDNRDDVTFLINGEEAELMHDDGLRYIEVTDIKPTDLAKEHTVTVSDNTNIYSFNYSAMSYCKKANSTSSDSRLKALANSLYWYNQAAMDYFDISSAPSETVHIHTWDEGKVIKEATCVNSGIRTLTCSICGQTKNELFTEDHILSDESRTQAVEGNDTYNCVEIIDAEIKTCTVCGTDVELRRFPRYSSHNMESTGEESRHATCTENAIYRAYCINRLEYHQNDSCTYVEDFEMPGTMLGHDFTDPKFDIQSPRCCYYFECCRSDCVERQVWGHTLGDTSDIPSTNEGATIYINCEQSEEGCNYRAEYAWQDESECYVFTGNWVSE